MVFAGAAPLKLPVKLPATNCPMLPNSDILTLIGLTAVVESLISWVRNVVKVCVLPAAIPAPVQPKLVERNGDTILNAFKKKPWLVVPLCSGLNVKLSTGAE